MMKQGKMGIRGGCLRMACLTIRHEAHLSQDALRKLRFIAICWRILSETSTRQFHYSHHLQILLLGARPAIKQKQLDETYDSQMFLIFYDTRSRHLNM